MMLTLTALPPAIHSIHPRFRIPNKPCTLSDGTAPNLAKVNDKEDDNDSLFTLSGLLGEYAAKLLISDVKATHRAEEHVCGAVGYPHTMAGERVFVLKFLG